MLDETSTRSWRWKMREEKVEGSMKLPERARRPRSSFLPHRFPLHRLRDCRRSIRTFSNPDDSVRHVPVFAPWLLTLQKTHRRNPRPFIECSSLLVWYSRDLGRPIREHCRLIEHPFPRLTDVENVHPPCRITRTSLAMSENLLKAERKTHFLPD